MPVTFFTFHAYRSWRADNPRGYVQRNEEGVQSPNPRLAAHREFHASQSAVAFSWAQMSFLLDEIPDICSRRNVTPHGASVTMTHIHLLASWCGEVEPKPMQDKLKQGIGYVLASHARVKGKKWLSRGGVPESVNGDAHFIYLLREYLPKHANEGGVWRVYDDMIPDTVYWK